MQILSFSLLIMLLTTGSFSFAALNPTWYPAAHITQSSEIQSNPLRCPSINQDESAMIARLQTLRDTIQTTANCKALSEGFKGLENLAGSSRSEFLALIEKSRTGVVLTEAESKKMVDYVEKATLKSASLAIMLSDSKQCLEEKDTSQYLMAISSLVNEGSALLSTVAGPWGAAIGIGGKVVAGLIQGVSRFIQSMPGYNFKDKKQWTGYVETLCLFHNQQDEINALIHPEESLKELQAIHGQIQNKLNSVLGSYPEASDMRTAFKNQNDKGLQQLITQVDSRNSRADGLKAVRLMSAQSWVQKRALLIQKNAQDPTVNSTGRHMIQQMRNETEQFLIADQGAKFLSFQLRDAEKQAEELRSVILNSGYPIYSQIAAYDSKLVKGAIDTYGYAQPEEVILDTLMSVDMYQFANARNEAADQIFASLTYFRRAINNQWDALILSYDVKYSFCDFFQKAGYYNPDMRLVCVSKKAKSVEALIEKYATTKISRQVPEYLNKYKKPVNGLDWTESLQNWLNVQ